MSITIKRTKPETELLEGDLRAILYAKNGFLIGKLNVSGDIIDFKGDALEQDFTPGTHLQLRGTWQVHPKYGRQFHFESYTIPQPVGDQAIIQYLQQCDGIGTVHACRIVEIYGKDTLDVLRVRTEEVAKKSGVKLEILNAAVRKLDERKANEKLLLDLMTMLDGNGFPKRLKSDLIHKYHDMAAEIVRRNPYLLQFWRGVSFAMCDRLFLQLGNSPEDPRRLRACVLQAVEMDTSGSTLIPEETAEKNFCDLTEGVGDFHSNLHEVDIMRPFPGFLEREEDFQTESLIMQEIERITHSRRLLLDSAPMENSPLTPHQREQLNRATLSNVGVLAGSPGTGKTFTAAQLIRALPLDRVAVAAPTGKAALRITEAMQSYGIDLTASTIHGLLECITDGGGTFVFQRDAYNPIDAEFIVVDESSMIDNQLMSSLLSAVPSGARVLFIGDPDQLPPIGRGAPLRDFIRHAQAGGDISCGTLSEIQRNAGDIVTACAHIRNRERFPENWTFNPEHNLTYTFRDCNPENLARLLRKLDNPTPEASQVIVALNESGACSRNAVNLLLQEHYNADAPKTDRPWRVGDKVICLKNGFATDDDRRQVRVANGDIGYVAGVSAEETLVMLNGNSLHVPRKGDTWSESDWALGYAITCHKSQGSEWPVVIVMLDPSSLYSIADRHWLYTAISRAKKNCYLMGNPFTAYSMTQRTNTWNRETGLFREPDVQTSRKAS